MPAITTTPQTQPPIQPSALTQILTAHPSPSPYHTLAHQITYNLRHQHDWTSLALHTRSPLPPHAPLPRPLVSGLPPTRIYVHPDEQIEMLAREKREASDAELRDGAVDGGMGRPGKEGAGGVAGGSAGAGVPEREWVLPTHLREKWSLRRFAEVFDAIGEEPPEAGGDGRAGDLERRGGKGRKGGKRVLLATVSDDSTVVYYIVHDGIVKPRQN